MPIYSYKCSKCGHAQDHLLKMSDTLETCPQCQSNEYKKQLTAPGSLSFKGGGFYETDYKAPCGASPKEVKQMGCGGNCACH